LSPPFDVDTYVLLCRPHGPAKGKQPFSAVGKVISQQKYNYHLCWHTQGPTLADVPGSVSKRTFNHRDLAPVSLNVDISAVKLVLEGTMELAVQGLVVDNILAKHQCKPPLNIVYNWPN